MSAEVEMQVLRLPVSVSPPAGWSIAGVAGDMAIYVRRVVPVPVEVLSNGRNGSA